MQKSVLHKMDSNSQAKYEWFLINGDLYLYKAFYPPL